MTLQRAQNKIVGNGQVSASQVDDANIAEFVDSQTVFLDAPKDLGHVFQQTQAALESNGTPFIAPSTKLYNTTLQGFPFIFASTPVYRRKPAQSVTLYDAQGRSTIKEFPDMDVVNIYIREINPQTMMCGEPLLAELQGAWLLPQMKNLGDNIYNYVWTVDKNPAKQNTPWMLALWQNQPDGVHQTVKRGGRMSDAEMIAKQNALGNPETAAQYGLQVPGHIQTPGANFPTSNTPQGKRPGSGTLGQIRGQSRDMSEYEQDSFGHGERIVPETPKKRGRPSKHNS
jgi:hypothetical protein